MRLQRILFIFSVCLVGFPALAMKSSSFSYKSQISSEKSNLSYLMKQEKTLQEFINEHKNGKSESDSFRKLGEIQFLIGNLYFNGEGVERDLLEAAIWWDKSSSHGNPQAQYNLGLMYWHGHGIEANEEKAFNYFLQAADQEHAKAQFNVGYIYENGIGVTKNFLLAFKYYRKAAKQEDVDALINLGNMYSEGKGIKKNRKQAVRCWEEAAKLGEPAGQYNLGVLHRHGDEELGIKPDPNLAVEWFLKAAKQESDMAQFLLGMMHKKGEGVEKNEEMALMWYKKSAANGNTLAPFMILKNKSMDPTDIDLKDGEGPLYHMMGAIFEEGDLAKKDIKKALEWHQKGAEQGNAEALFALTKLHSDEKEGSIDKKLAFQYCLEAAKKGHLIAQYNLGVMHAGGIGTTKDYKRSFKWFQESAHQGNIDAQYNLGISYLRGYGIEENPELAFKWLHKAAKQEHAASQYQLSLLYEYGKGIKKNITKSLKWLHKSARNGYSESQYLLGVKLLTGEGVRKNPEEARLWFEKAADQGDLTAQHNLALMYDKGEGIEENKERAFELFYNAATRGHISSQYSLASAYYVGAGVEQDIKTAFRWYLQAAEQNDFDAQRMLGVMYKSGEGVLRSDIRAAEWFIKAANQGCEASCLVIADMHQHGEGTLKDKGKSIKYLESIKDPRNLEAISDFLTHLKQVQSGKTLGDEYAWINRHVKYERGVLTLFFSIENRNPVVSNALSIMLKDGRNKIVKSVVNEYEKRAKQEQIPSQIKFAVMHEYGLGITKDIRKACEWYLEAAQRGSTDAQVILGISYKDNRLISKNSQNVLTEDFETIRPTLRDKISMMLSMAHSWVHTFHAYLGELYADGKISRPSNCGDQEVLSWLYGSSAKGNVKALYRLGRMYEHGWGTPKDGKAAFDCFQTAAQDYWYAPAQKALAEMYREGRGVDPSNHLAVKWYSRAGKQGDAVASAAIKEMADETDAPALYALGRAHEEGWGIARDEDEAMVQYEASALQGYFKGQHAIAVRQLEGKASFKEELNPLELLTTLSGEDARKTYLRLLGRKFDRKEKKRLKALHDQGLPEQGYYKAQHKLAELYEGGKVVPHKTIKDIRDSYQKAIQLYELAIKSNKPVAMAPLERVRSSLEKLQSMSDEERIRVDYPEFSQFLEEEAEEKKFGPEFLYQLAFLFTEANTFTKDVSHKLKKMIRLLISLPENSRQTQSILHMLTTLVHSKEFKEGLSLSQEDSDVYRLKSLSSLEESMGLIRRLWRLIPLPSTLSDSMGISKALLRDPRIEMFNSYFKQAETPYDADLFKRSVGKVLDLFDRLKKEGHIKNSSLYSEDDNDYGTRETLEKLLTHNYKPNNRFGHRLIRIADIIYGQFKKDPALVASQLTQWAKRGLNCLTASEEEMNRFYIEYITNTKTDSGALTKEDRTLEMQVALSLAKLRYRLLDELVTEKDEQRIHSVKHLEKKARIALSLLGDAENYTDESEFTIPPHCKEITSEHIVSRVLERYTPTFIAQHIAKQIEDKIIDYDKIYRRLRFQYIREKVAPEGELDQSLFQDEDYLLDHCTREEFTHHILSLSLLKDNKSNKTLPDWEALKGQSYEKARQQMESEFYDENYKFTPKGAQSLLRGMGYLEEELIIH